MYGFGAFGRGGRRGKGTVGNKVWSSEQFRWFDRAPRHLRGYTSKYGIKPKPPTLEKVKYGSDYAHSGHSANVMTGTIRTSEGTQQLGTASRSPFAEKIKKSKRRRGNAKGAAILGK